MREIKINESYLQKRRTGISLINNDYRDTSQSFKEKGVSIFRKVDYNGTCIIKSTNDNHIDSIGKGEVRCQ